MKLVQGDLCQRRRRAVAGFRDRARSSENSRDLSLSFLLNTTLYETIDAKMSKYQAHMLYERLLPTLSYPDSRSVFSVDQNQSTDTLRTS